MQPASRSRHADAHTIPPSHTPVIMLAIFVLMGPWVSGRTPLGRRNRCPFRRLCVPRAAVAAASSASVGPPHHHSPLPPPLPCPQVNADMYKDASSGQWAYTYLVVDSQSSSAGGSPQRLVLVAPR